ncbi:hypothetical protein [Acinetobacter pittii]|uniref:hypothetical protein n=1 Tax=Acinetobacter pittii TaxID=48296 RepID=UPI0029FFDB1A|nr:hypothetical protein [Acinetobacter pittii]MDX8255243.1 hypothetical protein [Acinetobacter pittii]
MSRYETIFREIYVLFLKYKCFERLKMVNNSEKDKKQENRDFREFLGVWLALIIIFVFWYYFPDFLQWINEKFTNQIDITNIKSEGLEKIGDKFGSFGDSYGSLNTLFSGWAFALLLISLFMQRKELQEQRKELSAQREEISKANEIAESQRTITEQQADLLEQQINEAILQNFYNIIYPLMNRKQGYYKEADLLPKQYTDRPIDNSIFYHVYSKTYHIYHQYCHNNQGVHNSSDEVIKDINLLINTNNSLVSPYYYLCNSQYIEHFIYMVNFINNFNGITKEDKITALSVFISDYSNKELYSISLVAFNNEFLREILVKNKLLNRIKNLDGFDYEEIFETVFCEEFYLGS